MIVFFIFSLIWNQTDVRLVPNQSENGKYNLISVSFNKVSKRLLCVHAWVFTMFCVGRINALCWGNLSSMIEVRLLERLQVFSSSWGPN